MTNTNRQGTAKSKPAEQALFENLDAQQLRLVASWLKEELSLNSQEYTPDSKRSFQRVSFIANRLDDIAERLESGKAIDSETLTGGETSSDENPTGEEKKIPWRFSDEYWEKYEADDD